MGTTAETLPTVLKVSMKAPNISAWDLLPRVFETLCLDPALRKEGSLADVHCKTLERHIAFILVHMARSADLYAILPRCMRKVVRPKNANVTQRYC